MIGNRYAFLILLGNRYAFLILLIQVWDIEIDFVLFLSNLMLS